MGKKIDLTRQVFCRLVVLRENGRSKSGQVLWLCKCLCGNEVTVTGQDLRNGKIQSCGCYHRERAAERHTKHGLYVSHPRLCTAICDHFRLIKNKVGSYGDWQIDPRYTLGSTGMAKFCEDLIALQSEECERYERDKSLDIDKDNDIGHIFRPETIVFVSRKENLSNRRKTLRLEDGTSLSMFCTKVGIQTCDNGNPSKQYGRICHMYRTSHKAHPELVQKANELIALYTKTLKLLQLLEDARRLRACV